MANMSEKFIDKNVKLSLEFDSYIARHPELFDNIPDGATVIITLKGDDEFNTASISLVKRSKSKRPVVEAEKSGSVWNIKPLVLKTA
jgi:hypothetical protein